MELTEKNIKSRLDFLRKDQSDENKESYLSNRLKEKGVECSIIIPIFETILDFDAMLDIKYEESSLEKNNQRFDFLINDDFVIEAKSLGTVLSTQVKQMKKYISGNDRINYGILTNGWHYAVFIQKSFIEIIANEGKSIPELKQQKVLNVLTLSLDDDLFFDKIKIFSKNIYKESFKKIARFVFSCVVPKRGKSPSIHEDRDIDKKLQEEIKEKVSIKKGAYYDQIKNGELKVGDKLIYKNDEIQIEIIIEENGIIRLPKDGAKILDMSKVIENGKYKPMVELVIGSWHESDSLYEDPKDIFRGALGKQRISDRYIFKKV